MRRFNAESAAESAALVVGWACPIRLPYQTLTRTKSRLWRALKTLAGAGIDNISLAAGQQRRKKAAIRREKRNKPRRPSGPRDRPSTRERRRIK
jgi:hypothetical protein